MHHGLQTFRQRLTRLEERAAQEGIVYTEAQLAALERARQERSESLKEVETHHLVYLLCQDTHFAGYIKGVGRIHQQTVIDTNSAVGFGNLYSAKVPITAADCLNDLVLPFFEKQGIPDLRILRILTDRGTEFRDLEDHHPDELYLQLQEIEHSKTQARHPQTNGIAERFHQTIQNEFYRVAFRKKVYNSLELLQQDLDGWVHFYNQERTHQGKHCQGRTPKTTFLDSRSLAQEKRIVKEESRGTCTLKSRLGQSDWSNRVFYISYPISRRN
jgi:transposase InsO family protein